MILTRDKHRMLLQLGAAVVSIAAVLVLLAFVFKTCGSPIDPLSFP